MGRDTKIEWATHTFNHVRGCVKVAAGCAHCYAERQSWRNPGTLGIWGNEKTGKRVLASAGMWAEPRKWNEAARCPTDTQNAGHCHKHPTGCPRPRVFCASIADVYEAWTGYIHGPDGRIWTKPPAAHEQGHEYWALCDQATQEQDPQGWKPVTMDDVRRRLFAQIDATPRLDWLLLTKRPQNIRRLTPGRSRCAAWPDCRHPDCEADHHYGNVWLGTSIAEQRDANANIRPLLDARPLAARLFLSCEPLIEQVSIREALYVGEDGGWEWAGAKRLMLDWVIIGGESGPLARPCNVEWIRSLIAEADAGEAAVFVKQLGSKPVYTYKGQHTDDGIRLKHPKGGDISEWPEDLRRQALPTPRG